MSGHEIAWMRGGRTMTREEYDRQEPVEKPSPSGGTRLLERILVASDDAWKKDAACRGKPTAWWFPEPNQFWSPIALRARQICASCPVLETCRATAQARNEHGIWGDTSNRTRATERRIERKANPKPQRARPVKAKKPPHRPLAPLSQAIVAALADGHWCDLDVLVERVRHAVDDDQARRRQVGVLRAKQRHVDPAQLGPAGVRAGQRQVVRDSLNTLQRRGFVEGIRGTWRLLAREEAS